MAFKEDPESIAEARNSTLILNAPVSVAAGTTLLRQDAINRRLSIPSFPSCNIYACPPGPCTVYDIDYQFEYTYSHSSKSYTFQSIGRCGPAFNIQTVDKNKSPFEYSAVPETVRTFFPEINEDSAEPIYVYKPLSSSSTGFSGLVPTVTSLRNRNPRYYYQNEYAFLSGSTEKDHLSTFKCTDSDPVLRHTPSSPFSRETFCYEKGASGKCAIPFDNRRLGSFADVGTGTSALEYLYINETNPGVIPQTFYKLGIPDDENNTQQAEYYKDTCDLSQCMLVPVVDQTNYGELGGLFNCFYQSMLQDIVESEDDPSKPPIPDIVRDYNSERCWPTNEAGWANLTNYQQTRRSRPLTTYTDGATYGVLKGTSVADDTWANGLMNFDIDSVFYPSGKSWGQFWFNQPNAEIAFASLPRKFKCISPTDSNVVQIAHSSGFREQSNVAVPGDFGQCFGYNAINPDGLESTLDCIINRYLTPMKKNNNVLKDFVEYKRVKGYTDIKDGIFYDMQLLQITTNRGIKFPKNIRPADFVDRVKYFDYPANTVQFWMWMDYIYERYMLNETAYPSQSPVYNVPATYKTNLHPYETSTYKPLQVALSGYPLSPAPTLALNASILNSYTKSESAACNCGNQGIQYAFLDLPWSAIQEEVGKTPPSADMVAFHKAFSVGSLHPSDLSYSSTALRQSSYSWNNPATGDFRDGLPIGLYIPSSRRFDRNFTTIERDFLRNKTRIMDTAEFELSEELAERYYAGEKAPEPNVLQGELLFKGAPPESLPYKTRTMIYQYGACMKPPYGQYSSFEYSQDDFHTLFPNCNYDDDECYVTEESLIGYCEEIPDISGSNRLGYCFDDPLSFTNRQNLCKNPRAKNIVLAQTLGVRSPQNICSKTSKTCLIIPGEPGASMNAILNSPDVYGDLSGYTLLVTPFNYSIATAITASGRHMYPAGNLKGMTSIDDSNTTILGTAAVEKEYFRALYDQTKGVNHTIESIDRIVDILQPDPNMTSFDFPYITEVPQVTLDFLFPFHPIAGVVVNYPGVTIRPASTKLNLQIVPVLGETDASPVPCTFAYIGAADFFLANTVIDYATCPIKSGMDASAVVFGGSDVRSSRVFVDVRNSTEPGVLFAGGDIAHFPRAPTVNATNVTVSLAEYRDPSLFAVAAAKTHGDITLDLNNTNLNGSAHVLVQPGTTTTSNADQTLEWDTTADNITLTIIDVSIYTRVFGDNILELDYPQTHAKSHFHLAVFVISILIIVFVVAIFAKRWIEFYFTYLREGNYDSGVEVRTTVFGQIIDLPNRSVPVGTYMEKHSAEYHKPATGMLDAAVAGNLNQSLRRRGGTSTA